MVNISLYYLHTEDTISIHLIYTEDTNTLLYDYKEHIIIELHTLLNILYDKLNQLYTIYFLFL